MARLVLIQEPDALIRLDLAQTVAEIWPAAEVILCRRAEQVLAALALGKRPDVMVLRQSLRSLRLNGLAALVARIAPRVLLTCADPSEAKGLRAAGWTALEMPFTTAQLTGALRRRHVVVPRWPERHCIGYAAG